MRLPLWSPLLSRLRLLLLLLLVVVVVVFFLFFLFFLFFWSVVELIVLLLSFCLLLLLLLLLPSWFFLFMAAPFLVWSTVSLSVGVWWLLLFSPAGCTSARLVPFPRKYDVRLRASLE